VDGIIPGIEQARAANIPVVTVNQNISKPELVNSFVGVSHVQGGEMEMQAAADALGGKGNIVVLHGPMGSDAQIGRDQGYKNVLAKYPDIKIVYEQTANWKTDEALKLVENWLQTGTQIDAIVSQNDAMAVGAEKAVEDAQMLDKIMIFGLDATPDALALIKDGKMTATVSQSTTQQGVNAMDAAYKIVTGETVEPAITVEHTLINKDNVAEFIQE
jgi:ribose transport system substrate-binding protein/inositol transport system substrate-binding protein